jgi:hypothetical protein
MGFFSKGNSLLQNKAFGTNEEQQYEIMPLINTIPSIFLLVSPVNGDRADAHQHKN